MDQTLHTKVCLGVLAFCENSLNLETQLVVGYQSSVVVPVDPPES